MFENIGKKIVGVGKGVMRGTQNFSETVSLNAKIDECKKELGNCFSQLGQAYFNRTTEVPPEYQGIFDRIHMLNQTINQLQEQIKVIKGIRQCPNCGAEVPGNVMFCGNCGFSMPPVQQNQSAAWNGPVCARCGAPLEEGAAFCTNCGARVEAPQPQAAPQFQSVPAGKVCPKCGTPAAPDAAFCNECGTSLLESAPVVEPPVQEQPVQEPTVREQPEYSFDPGLQQPEFAEAGSPSEPVQREAEPEPEPAPFEAEPAPEPKPAAAARVCPNCGTQLEEDAVFCSECGTRVG